MGGFGRLTTCDGSLSFLHIPGIPFHQSFVVMVLLFTLHQKRGGGCGAEWEIDIRMDRFYVTYNYLFCLFCKLHHNQHGLLTVCGLQSVDYSLWTTVAMKSVSELAR